MTTYLGVTYRLRAGSPMPTSTSGYFVLHSFMGEQHDQTIDTCADTLLASTDFRGQGGSFISASYSRLPIRGSNGLYKATSSSNTRYVEELE